jgi:hypothetical protein
MPTLRFRGREIRPEEILYIRALIEEYPADSRRKLSDSRRKLSARLWEAWNWRQSNGALRDMVCRGLLLMLERAREIALPPVAYPAPQSIGAEVAAGLGRGGPSGEGRHVSAAALEAIDAVSAPSRGTAR